MAQDYKWKKIKEIFSKAIELEGKERDQYIRKACAGDKGLFEELHSLLKSHDRAGVMDLRIGSIRKSAITSARNERAKGRKVGRYKIIEEVGFGGMGSVYMAERADGEFKHRVALKLLHSPFASKNDVERFKSERQILATLQHDNIARLLDGGVTEQGQPYYVMEFVDGKPINQYCNDHQLTINERLELFQDVCGAIQYAHQKLIVHRDLKPSNILVTGNGRVKLLDFGIAKVLKEFDAAAPLTQPGLLPLTPSYASPEQIRGENVATSSDIYQLGIVLYELLTGKRPYEVSGKSPGEIERIICEKILTRPSLAIAKPSKSPGQANMQNYTDSTGQLRKKLRGDLDNILLKALHKEPERRYDSAEQFGTDIRLYLSARPVTAHPDSKLYRAGKYIKRHRWGVTATLAIFLSLIMGISAAMWQAREAQTALAKSEEALNRAEALHGFLTDLFLPGSLGRPAGQMPSTEELLEIGARQALEGGISEPSERLGVMVTLGEIYLQRGWPDEARPLLDAAIKLGYEHKNEWPQDLARALYLKARITGWDGNREKSEELYLEAENILKGLDKHWDLYAMARSGRGYLEYYRGEYAEAIKIAEPLYMQLEEAGHPDKHLKNRILNLLAISYGHTGELEKADEFQNRVIEIYGALEGDDSRVYAISLTNSINLKFNLGLFEQANENAVEAISIYDKIYESPTSVQAVTYGALSIIQLLEGRFDEALETLETAGRYFAEVRNQNFEEWEVPQIYKGMMLAYMQRWDEAKPYLINNREHFPDIHHTMLFTSIDGLLAEALCRNGETEEGQAVLAGTRPLAEMENPVIRSKIYEARARCHSAAGNREAALQDIEISIEAMRYPGRAMERAERKQLKAEILTAMGNFNEAMAELQKAESLYQNTNLGGHPGYAILEKNLKNLSGVAD